MEPQDDEREAKRRKLMGRAMVIGLGALVLVYALVTFIR